MRDLFDKLKLIESAPYPSNDKLLMNLSIADLKDIIKRLETAPDKESDTVKTWLPLAKQILAQKEGK